MNRLEKTVAALKAENKSARTGFLVAGDPCGGATLAEMKKLADSGTDILELAVPFSDPTADGPAVQEAAQRAIKSGMTLRKTIALVKDFREERQTPVVLRSYGNLLYHEGYESIAEAAADAGVDGLLALDIPPEESEELDAAFTKNGMCMIRVVAMSSTAKRIARIVDGASGYLSLAAGSAAPEAVNAKLAEIRRYSELYVIQG